MFFGGEGSALHTYTDGLYISDLDFFGSNIQAHKKINEIYLDSLNFMYPSSSKRMLQDYSIPRITEIVGDDDETVIKMLKGW